MQTAKELVTHLSSNYTVYKYRNYVKIDDTNYTQEKFELFVYQTLGAKIASLPNASEVISEAFKLCKELKKIDEDEVDLEGELELLKYVTVAIDSLTGDYIMYNKETYEIVSELSVDGVMNKLSSKAQKVLKKNAPIVVQYFNPYKSTEPVIHETHPKLFMPVIELNQYTPPSYLELEATPELPPKVKTYLEYFFPIEESREYVYDWIHNLLVNKNETILYLVGTQGTGKNVLAEQVLARLIGQEYQHTSDQHVSESQFNGFLRNKQLFFLDEFTAKSTSKLNYIKKMTNRKVTIAAKFKEAKMRDSYLNLIIANNEMNAVRLSVGDRRISVPDIADVRIDKVLGKNFVDDMIREELEDEQVLANIRAFFVNRTPKYTGVQAYQEDKFLECCIKSLGTYMSYIYDIILEAKYTYEMVDVSYDYILNRYKEKTGTLSKSAKYPMPLTIYEKFKETPFKGQNIIEDMVMEEGNYTNPNYILNLEKYNESKRSLEDFKPEEE